MSSRRAIIYKQGANGASVMRLVPKELSNLAVEREQNMEVKPVITFHGIPLHPKAMHKHKYCNWEGDYQVLYAALETKNK